MSDNKLAVPIAIVIAGVLVGAAIFFTAKNSAPAALPGGTAATQAAGAQPDVDPVTSSDHIRGNPNAPIVIVEYTDLECPYCKAFHATMQQVMTDYGASGKVAWVIRDFPITSLHPKAENEAIAAECAVSVGGSEKYWEFVDQVFAITPSNNGLDPAELPIIAGKIGLDVNAFNTCLTSQQTKAVVDADYASGVKAGVSGTPTSFVITKNGVQTTIPGAQQYSYVKSIIDTILASDPTAAAMTASTSTTVTDTATSSSY